MPSLEPYDAVLLVSFGGPEKPADVVPFLQNVTAGKNIPPERLEEVGAHYYSFGGRSPINDQCRALKAALCDELEARAIDLPVYWGNRNWDPYLSDAVAEMERDGVRRAVAVTTSAYSSYSGCRQYREDLYEATAGSAVDVDLIRAYFNDEGFGRSVVDAVEAAWENHSPQTQVVFVTHAIPDSMNEASGGPGVRAYERQHADLAAWVADAISARRGHEVEWSLAYCSRSGPPSVPWLEPDVNDALEELAKSGVPEAIVVPFGFVSDHMEVIYDLDTEAAETAASVGLKMTRAATSGTAPGFVSALVDLVEERAGRARGEATRRPVVGTLPPSGPRCAVDCCANPRGPRPAIEQEPVA